jgi:hypothetical protein
MARGADGSLTVSELQQQIFDREGFRVSFERFDRADVPLPAYDYPVMCPNGWRVSDWRRLRLVRYLTAFKNVTVFRGDGSPLKRDVKLAHLRDTYYEAVYGTLSPELPENVVSLDAQRSRRAQK